MVALKLKKKIKFWLYLVKKKVANGYIFCCKDKMF